MNISTLFARSEKVVLPVEVEAQAIREAQAGSEEAQVLLLETYGPALRSAVSTFVRRLPQEEQAQAREDAQMEAVAAFLGMLADHDPEKSPRLAGRVSQVLAEALGEAATPDAALTIPARTLKRFYGILRKADGDLEAARALAPSLGMSVHVFDEILSVVRYSESLTAHEGEDGSGDTLSRGAATSIWNDGEEPFAEVEDAILFEIAFRAVNDDERTVIRYAYGFETGDALSDAAVVHAMSEHALGEERVSGGETVISRPAVQRRRASGLAKMREAFGVGLEG